MVNVEYQRVTDYLITDHARLHALLADAADGERFDANVFEAFRAALLRHIGIEEKLVFAAARRALGGEPLAHGPELRIEHGALSSLLVPTPDRALCAEIRSLLRAHDAKEEGPDGVYAACEHLLSPSESQALAAQAAAFPEVPLARHFDGPGVHRTAASALGSARHAREHVTLRTRRS
jgi:hypothetical protein